jgi:hypothetical protein
MPNTDDKPALKITLDDLAKVELRGETPSGAMVPMAAGDRQYGTIAPAGAEPASTTTEKSSIFLQGWFYLGIAGLLGAVLGWAIIEPFIHDGMARNWSNILPILIVVPSVLIFMCLGLSIAESIVERSLRKALLRGALSLPLGLVFAIVFMIAGSLVFQIGKELCAAAGIDTRSIEAYRNPAFWIARGLAWMVFASAAGIVYGLVDRSVKKGRYGVIGAVIGGGIGGVLFDPISMVTHSAGPSRGIGFGLIGLAAGVAIGIVESALKDRWLYVAAGPLAGKQFILYKPITTIGSSQKSDIYLFKDNSILPQHGVIELRGAQTFLRSDGPIFVSGQPVRMRALESGDLIQVGRYAFHFRERHRS